MFVSFQDFRRCLLTVKWMSLFDKLTVVQRTVFGTPGLPSQCHKKFTTHFSLTVESYDIDYIFKRLFLPL